MKIKFIVLLVLLYIPFIAQSGVYKHVDKQGNVTYSNIRGNNTKEVDLPSITVVPAIDSKSVNSKIKKRMESIRIGEHREEIEYKITEESNHLEALRSEYKGGEPDRLGSERNYQRYLDRVERLKGEISLREDNLDALKQELQNVPY
jgi:ribosome assembly protein YihI (activator of Der GTPase)